MATAHFPISQPEGTYIPCCMSRLRWTAIPVLCLSAYAADEPGDTSRLFGPVPQVEAASLHAQSIQDAPATVTVITEDEIRRFGYRTLGEALTHVRGFYSSTDLAYRYLGIRGLLIPGDFNARLLVMINGHNMIDGIYGSNNYFEQDFGLDMELVKRIEVVRGPSSSLYGSNGIFATVNVITKSPAEFDRGHLTAEFTSRGEKKTGVATAADLGHGINLLLSASIVRNPGVEYYFPEFDSPATNNGRAVGVDNSSAYHTFANLVWGNWSFTASFNASEKNDPTAPYGTVFNARSAVARDTRDFAELTWRKETSYGSWRARIFWDRYRYLGFWQTAGEPGPVGENRDSAFGEQLGAEVTFRRDLPGRLGFLTLGTSYAGDLSARQKNYDLAPVPSVSFDINTPNRGYAIFLQHELPLGPSTTLLYGGRFDDAHFNSDYFSPRAALLQKLGRRTTAKLLYGRSFRNPSPYEQFTENSGAAGNSSGLHREMADTVEAVVEYSGRRIRLQASGYEYWMRDLILSQPAPDGSMHFQNAADITARGFGIEAAGKLFGGVEAGASLSLQTVSDVARAGAFPNSPRLLVKSFASMPLRRWLDWTITTDSVSKRAGAMGNWLGGYTVVDSTVSTNFHSRFDFVAGVRNALGSRYRDPLSPDHSVTSVQAGRRLFFVQLVTHLGGL